MDDILLPHYFADLEVNDEHFCLDEDSATPPRPERRHAREDQSKVFWKARRQKTREKAKEKRRADKLTDPNFAARQRAAHSLKDQWKDKSLHEIAFFGPHVVIDLSFQDRMDSKELSSVAAQILHAYGHHRRAERPLQLHVTSLVDAALDHLAKNVGFRSWKIFYHEEHFADVFEPESIVYMTGDSPDVLERLDESKVYIIGGISDNGNAMAGATYAEAKRLGLQTARLPIDRYMAVNKSCALNVNHVFEIVTDVARDGDWARAFERSIPARMRRPAAPGFTAPRQNGCDNLSNASSDGALDVSEPVVPSDCSEPAELSAARA
eukprot:TRINITY_DN12034_c0_g1_i1.p1 TRINITY_DN12034_c0_g1~~TRINITY_DN12034_c0_g1_i1.p1  ORF type:complete len:323 (+),score=67.31 TRINITY_DN12034_c0_g1_i1:40-1008(+)